MPKVFVLYTLYIVQSLSSEIDQHSAEIDQHSAKMNHHGAEME
ncbi:hypothetical protein [Bergeyella zoohelcum]|nr:hypothetical protein [Bergeyella zoohelcum]